MARDLEEPIFPIGVKVCDYDSYGIDSTITMRRKHCLCCVAADGILKPRHKTGHVCYCPISQRGTHKVQSQENLPTFYSTL